ncbi:MAG: S41 family peptidase [Candidatus Omnitrophica bacterium]|nr:S41 family peptidase [Candidatus Omnitrophota bacterium]
MRVIKKRVWVGVLLVFMVGTALIALAENKRFVDDSEELFKEIQIFADSVTLIGADYIESVPLKDLVYGAIGGMMRTLGGYNQFLDPESFEEITVETKGEFGGVGISVGMESGILTVISTMEDTPAFSAGIKPGDRIVKIDGKSTRGAAFDESVKKLRGAAGTKVTITVFREKTDKISEFIVTRAIIKLESVKDPEIIEGDIGYIKVSEFQEKTVGDLDKEISKLNKKGMKSLILDLRNNPGGLLDAAIEVSDLFLEKGLLIVYIEGRNPAQKVEFFSEKEAKYADINLAVIVNKTSASAAEIFAGAMKDNKRALVIGTRTFGKGSVQTVIPLGDKSALRLTTAAYFTPRGDNLRDKGIDPDVYVEQKELVREKMLTDDEEDESRIFEKAEPSAAKEKITDRIYDNQLHTAVSVLKGIDVFFERTEKSKETANVTS